MRGRATVADAVSGESIDASMRARILAEGNREADQCIPVLLGLAALPLLLGAALLAVSSAARRRAGAGVH